jgi:uncharacterized repeat protein (TIGR03803 family)
MIGTVGRRRIGASLSAAVLACLGARAASAEHLRTLYAFSGPDGASPVAPVIIVDSVLYGTTSSGGAGGCVSNDCGAVFAFDLIGRTLRVLHSFTNSPDDGAFPKAPVLYDHGALIGTTEGGGTDGQGTVFVLDPRTGAEGLWHSFTGQGSDGGNPTAGITKAGNAYFGTTTLTNGTVFRTHVYSPSLRTVFAFGGVNGYDPLSGLTELNGRLVGTAYEGGAYGGGNIYAIDPGSGVETVLYDFPGGVQGANPAGGVTPHAGYLYGTTYRGGTAPCGCGTLFRLDPDTGQETVLYSFTGGADGANPQSALLSDGDSLYGTNRGAHTGCDGSGCGTIFRFDLPTGKFTTLYRFTGGADGGLPLAGLTLSSAQVIYGTTSLGGNIGCGNGSGCGTLFALTR